MMRTLGVSLIILLSLLSITCSGERGRRIFIEDLRELKVGDTSSADEEKKTKSKKKDSSENPAAPVTDAPTAAPDKTDAPTPPEQPETDVPTAAPTDKPTFSPTQKPTFSPTQKPTAAPTDAPTKVPTAAPVECEEVGEGLCRDNNDRRFSFCDMGTSLTPDECATTCSTTNGCPGYQLTTEGGCHVLMQPWGNDRSCPNGATYVPDGEGTNSVEQSLADESGEMCYRCPFEEVEPDKECSFFGIGYCEDANGDFFPYCDMGRGWTAEECSAACVANPSCHGFEYDLENAGCSPLMQPSDDYSSCSSYAFAFYDVFAGIPLVGQGPIVDSAGDDDSIHCYKCS